MIALITSATGKKHRDNLLYLYDSICKYNWNHAELYPIVDEPIGLPNEMVVTSTEWGGRDLKCLFATHHDIEDDMPVAWIDSDCLAVGEEPEWNIPPEDSVFGHVWWKIDEKTHLPEELKIRMHNPPDGTGVLSSYFIQFHNMTQARKVCRAWHSNFIVDKNYWEEKAPESGTDEISLFNALRDTRVKTQTFPQLHHRDNGRYPYPQLFHRS